MKRYFFAGIAMLAAVAGAPAAEAGPREDVMSGASRCFQLSDDRAWLACYFSAAKPMQTALGTNAPGTPSVAAGAPTGGGLAFGAAPAASAGQPIVIYAAPPKTPEAPSWFSRVLGNPGLQTAQDFGRENVASNQPAQGPLVDRVIAHVSNYSIWGGGYFTVTLDNGQVWQQIGGDEDFAPLKRNVTYVATVAHGYFGDFSLSIQGIKGIYRVHRIS